jgi:phosphoenolpyruvate carboxylase
MSESQIERIEKALRELIEAKEGLSTTKAWFRNAAIVFSAATVVTIGSVFVNNYRLNKAEEAISLAASKRSFELLEQSFDANTNAMLNLVDKNYKDAAREFVKETKKINDNIFQFSTSITRGSGGGSNGGAR